MRTSYIFCIQGNRYIHSLSATLKLMVFNTVYRRILSLHCVQMIISTKFGFQTKHRHVQSCVRKFRLKVLRLRTFTGAADKLHRQVQRLSENCDEQYAGFGNCVQRSKLRALCTPKHFVARQGKSTQLRRLNHCMSRIFAPSFKAQRNIRMKILWHALIAGSGCASPRYAETSVSCAATALTQFSVPTAFFFLVSFSFLLVAPAVMKRLERGDGS